MRGTGARFRAAQAVSKRTEPDASPETICNNARGFTHLAIPLDEEVRWHNDQRDVQPPLACIHAHRRLQKGARRHVPSPMVLVAPFCVCVHSLGIGMRANLRMCQARSMVTWSKSPLHTVMASAKRAMHLEPRARKKSASIPFGPGAPPPPPSCRQLGPNSSNGVLEPRRRNREFQQHSEYAAMS